MKYQVLFPLHLEILLHILTDHFDLAVRSLAELVDDQVSVVSTEVVTEYRDPETERALQVALAVSSADEESCDIVVVTNLWPLRIVLLKRLAADVAFGRILILLPLLGAHPLHRPICSGVPPRSPSSTR